MSFFLTPADFDIVHLLEEHSRILIFAGPLTLTTSGFEDIRIFSLALSVPHFHLPRPPLVCIFLMRSVLLYGTG